MKVLLVAGRPPWPPHRGDQLRVAQLTAALAGEHQVTLLAPRAAGEPPAPPSLRRETVAASRAASLFAAPRVLLAGWPLQAVPFAQPDLTRQLRRLAPEHDVTVLLLARLAPHLAALGNSPLVADLIDCLSLNAATRAVVAPPWQRPLLRLEATRLRRAESTLLSRARRSLVVGERDRRELAAVAPAFASRLAVAPIAVPPALAAAAASRRTAPTLMLTGNLGYFANRDAAEWWLRQVWPRLRRREPRLRLVVAGARPPATLARRVRAAGGELVAQPPDLRALLATATVAVVPLRCGSGVPLKVLDAWAAGAPVVASRFAAAGAGAVADRDLLLADAPEEWEAQVLRLLADGELRDRLAAAGVAQIAALAPELVYPRLRELVLGGG
jgi:polysaccharide biosynthesis protein PslH